MQRACKPYRLHKSILDRFDQSKVLERSRTKHAAAWAEAFFQSACAGRVGWPAGQGRLV